MTPTGLRYTPEHKFTLAFESGLDVDKIVNFVTDEIASEEAEDMLEIAVLMK